VAGGDPRRFLRAHDFLTWPASLRHRLRHTVGMTLTEDMQQVVLTLPDRIRGLPLIGMSASRRRLWGSTRRRLEFAAATLALPIWATLSRYGSASASGV